MAITAWIVATVKNATSRPWFPNQVPWGGRLSPTAKSPAAKPRAGRTAHESGRRRRSARMSAATNHVGPLSSWKSGSQWNV